MRLEEGSRRSSTRLFLSKVAARERLDGGAGSRSRTAMLDSVRANVGTQELAQTRVDDRFERHSGGQAVSRLGPVRGRAPHRGHLPLS